VAQEASAHHTMSALTGKTKLDFHTKFAAEMPAR